MNTTNLPGLTAAFANASNEMLAAILDQSADCIKVIGPQGTVDYMNRNGQCAMEIEDFCAIAGQTWTSLWPETSRATIEEAMASARAGLSARFEAFCPTAKGSPRWWDVSVSPLRRPDGSMEGFVATSRDMTDRVSLAALREAVTDEMRHRLRNNYVVVGSLLSAYARGKPDQEAFVREMVERLSGLGIAQTMKAEGGNACLLAELVPALVLPYATPNCQISISELPQANLDQEQVDALALVLGELAVNAMKHGALSAQGSINVVGTRENGSIAIEWSERSDRAVTSHEREGGQGVRLMKRVLSLRKGDIDFDWVPNGVDVTVRMAGIS